MKPQKSNIIPQPSTPVATSVAVLGSSPIGLVTAAGLAKLGNRVVLYDKAGSKINLMRWVSPRTIKETFVPATDYKYPFLQAD